MFICLAICAACACHLDILISEESLFVDAITIGRPEGCEKTTITLIGFLKAGQVSESSECKAKPRRTHQLTSILVTGKFSTK